MSGANMYHISWHRICIEDYDQPNCIRFAGFDSPYCSIQRSKGARLSPFLLVFLLYLINFDSSR